MDCIECQDGLMPQRVIKNGRANYHCAVCDSDVTLALVLLAEAFGEMPKEITQVSKRISSQEPSADGQCREKTKAKE